jgi:hypothetical protein
MHLIHVFQSIIHRIEDGLYDCCWNEDNENQVIS